MNKGQLIVELEKKLGSKKVAADALEAVLDAIIREVATGGRDGKGKVGITGFGTFQRVARAARIGRNPRTGERVKIKKTVVPKFRAGTAFANNVADPRTLPKTTPAGARAAVGTRASAATPGAKKAAPAKVVAAKKATPAKLVKKVAPAKKAVVKKAAPAKKAVVKKAAPAKKAVVKKAAPAKKAAVKKAAPAKKAAAKKATKRA